MAPVDIFRFERQVVDSDPKRVGDRIADGGRCRREAGFTQTFGAIGAFGLRALDDDRNHLRHVQRSDQVIIEKRRVTHFAGIVDDHFFVQRGADAHGDAAFDLRHAIQWVDRLADIVRRRHA